MLFFVSKENIIDFITAYGTITKYRYPYPNQIEYFIMVCRCDKNPFTTFAREHAYDPIYIMKKVITKYAIPKIRLLMDV